MLEQIGANTQAGADNSARNALQDEAMKSSSKSLDLKSQSPAAGDLQNANMPALSLNEQRIQSEKTFFKDFFEKRNVELDPMQKGEGPYQSLEHMLKEGKVQMSEEEIQAEAKRIQDRDAKILGRSSYTTSDHIKFWSEEEIAKKVQDMVDKPKGIDVSNWQKEIDWKQVKDAGYQFAFMKATEGTDYVDYTFDKNRQGAKDAGLKVGFYHYFHPEDSVDAQVKLFCDKIGKAEPDALRLVIDAEDPDKWTRFPLDQRVKMVDDFLQGVKNRTGLTPEVCVYCSPNFADEILGNSPVLQKYSLWIANYGVDQPRLPGPWGKWDFWQYTSSGKVPGINGRVDLNVFNGSDINQKQVNKDQVQRS